MSIPDIDVVVYPAGSSTTQRQLQYLELAPADNGQFSIPLPFSNILVVEDSELIAGDRTRAASA